MYNKHFINAVVASIVLHILLFILFQYGQKLFPTPDGGASPMEVFIQQPDGGWKIADITNSLNDKKPDNSKFLGMQNQSVQEETVSRNMERGNGARSQKPETRNLKRETVSDSSKKAKEPQKSHDIKNLYDFDKKLFAKRMPRPSDSAAVIGGSGRGERGMSEDFYPDYKIGVHTYLNVLRYPDVEYFVRLKRIFKTTWDPVTAIRRDMSGLSISRGTVSVVLAVTVDRAGSLSELFVLRSSGLANYDSEALRTIRSSSPFSSPPDKFLEKDGVLRMSWTFVMYM